MFLIIWECFWLNFNLGYNSADGIMGRSTSKRLTTYLWMVNNWDYKSAQLSSQFYLFDPEYTSFFLVGQVCSFLVRPSDSTPGDYSLFFRTNEIIQRFKICPTPSNQFIMGGRYYSRSEALLTCHVGAPMVERLVVRLVFLFVCLFNTLTSMYINGRKFIFFFLLV